MDVNWTSDEIELLRASYKTCGTDIPGLRRKYTPNAIKHKARKLGLSTDVWKGNWTPAEDAILVDKYPIEGIKVKAYLPNRSEAAIAQRASQLGVCRTRTRWTEEEINLLCTYYSTKGIDIPELRMTRTPDAIMTKAQSLGLSSARDLIFDNTSVPVTFNGVQYPSTAACARAEGVSEGWVRAHRDSETGSVTGSKPVPTRVVLGSYHGEEITFQEACTRFNWPPNEKTRRALKYDNIEFECLIDTCLKLDILPSSLVKLHMEFGDLQAVQEWVLSHGRAFRDGALLSSWRTVPAGGKPATVIVNGIAYSSAHKLCEALGVKQDGRYVDFLCVASLDHQRIIDEFLNGGPPPIRAIYSSPRRSQQGWGAWPEDEVKLLLETYTLGGIELCAEKFQKYTGTQIRRQLIRIGCIKPIDMAPRGRAARSPDVESLASAATDYYYCTCKICRRVFLIRAGSEVEFSHTTHTMPVPDGWYISPTKRVRKP